MDINYVDAWVPVANIDPSMGIRKRTTRGNRQEAQDDASIDNSPVGIGSRPVDEETLPYSIARFLNQPGKAGTIGELQYFS